MRKKISKTPKGVSNAAEDGHKPVECRVDTKSHFIAQRAERTKNMAALVESMMYVRETPWHGLGTRVEEAPNSKEALELAGLNWTIDGMPIYDAFGKEIAGYKANTRSSDNKVLGIVGSRYSIVQNTDAFAFTDSLIGEGIKYETAGSLMGGKKIWLLGRMPERTIVGDKFDPYICFTNTHDGTGAVRACMTPVRVVCNNTLNMALSTAKRSWSARHVGDISAKLEDAKRTLELADEYLIKLDEEADKLANEKFTEGDMKKALDQLFPIAEDATERQKQTAENAKEEIIICSLRPDIAQFLNTKWGFLNAVSDFVGHSEPARRTRNFDENRWGYIINGHYIFDKAVQLVAA